MLESPPLATPLPEDTDWPRLLRGAADSACPCRDRAILHLIWWLALTAQDVVALRLQDVDLVAGTIRWGQGRSGLLPADALAALTAYVSTERARHGAALFCDRHGRPLGPAAIARIFTRLRRTTGVAVDPHTLRLAALYRLLRRDPLRALTALRPQGEPWHLGRAAR